MLLADELIQDIRYAARQLRRSPGFTAVALLALALGIGATVTVFKVLNAVLVKPLPFERADELYRVAKTSSSGIEQGLSVPEFDRWQKENRTVASLAGFTPMDFNVRGPNPEGLLVVWASRSFLDVLGITPQVGRPFATSDFESGSERTALVSHELWRRRYGSDPAIVGTQVDLEGPDFLSDSSGRYTIIGVLPQRLWLFSSRHDFVVPMRASAEQMNDTKRRLVATVIARVTSAGQEAVRSDIAAISRRADRDVFPSEAPPTSIDVTSLREWHLGNLWSPLVFLMGMALLVALIACANVALVLVARTSYRQRELAIRSALGAGRGRLIRQLLTESLLLSLLGGLAGILVAAGSTRVVATLIPSSVVSRISGGIESVSLDGHVLAVAIVAIIATGLLSGVGSLFAFNIARSFDHLRQGGLGKLHLNRHTLQTVLVVGQSAIAVVILIVAGLLLRSLGYLHSVDLGITPRPGLVVWLNMNPSRYPQDDDRARFYWAVLERLEAQPEIRQASGTDMLFYHEWQTVRFGTTTTTSAEPSRWTEALVRAVTPTYFERHGIRIVQGRFFTSRDDTSSLPVTIVSQTFAERYWSGVSVIGQPLRTVTPSGQPVTSIVVGVVADIRSAPHAQPKPIIYRPFQQAPPPWMYITVEGTTDSAALLPVIRRAVWSVDPDQPLEGASGGPWTLSEMLFDLTAQPRLIATIGNTLATIALLLAMVGVYGLLSYSVARRTSEFGVRMALGAEPVKVMGLVLRRTLAVTMLGIALGLAAAAFITRFIESMLFGVTPLDPLTFILAGLTFLLVSSLATLVPVRRAMTVSPLVALRAE